MKLRVDSRDQHAHEYGQVDTFADELDFGSNVPRTIEAPGGAYCTALSSCKAGTSQTSNLYNVDTLWAETPHTASGADPRDTLGAMVKYGLEIQGNTVIDKLWSGYFRGDTGPLDAFDNVRSAMTLSKSAITVATPWYRNWNECESGEVMPMGDVQVSAHDWIVIGWKEINGSIMFVIDAHQGYTLLMPRDVFNAAVGTLGAGAYMPSTQAIDAVRKRNIMEWIIDLASNVILLIEQKILILKNQ